jgi:hypothetical protein
MGREEEEGVGGDFHFYVSKWVQSQARPQHGGPRSKPVTFVYLPVYSYMAMAGCHCDCSIYSVYMS